MNKNRKMVIVLLFAFVVAFLLQAVLYRTESKNIPVARNQCYLNTENVTRFSYKW